ncbi:preprotein translocase subunit SecE [Trinickia caryophylli]|nr:preprotein translocase subunit SecE [Trinickia caryophylli]PMS09285.1 preprotein translocase subunit SecE [Trinickia caryophylli]TRX19356.1 preprotein translocase subunit SecE [Trinickia caryophylli]WQE13337.1 preprotein translocase subunit SecE [Trinickia caryophylli]GLU35816.1 protein translocase subunit SecE [Trinickia caryophylli]
MANPSVEAVDTSSDKLMLIAGVLLVLAGFVAFFWLSGQQWYVRGAALAVGVAAGVVVGLFSSPGKGFIAFAKESYKEVRKVVWPTRKEATQTTLVVFGFVLVMAVFLWVSDKSIEWAIFSAILGWK